MDICAVVEVLASMVHRADERIADHRHYLLKFQYALDI